MICHRIGAYLFRLHCCYTDDKPYVSMLQIIKPGDRVDTSDLNCGVRKLSDVHPTLLSMFAAVIDYNQFGAEVYMELSPIIDFIIEMEPLFRDGLYDRLRERLTEIVSQHHTGATT